MEVAPTSKLAWISEELCIGCGICVKVRSYIWCDNDTCDCELGQDMSVTSACSCCMFIAVASRMSPADPGLPELTADAEMPL